MRKNLFFCEDISFGVSSFLNSGGLLTRVKFEIGAKTLNSCLLGLSTKGRVTGRKGYRTELSYCQCIQYHFASWAAVRWFCLVRTWIWNSCSEERRNHRRASKWIVWAPTQFSIYVNCNSFIQIFRINMDKNGWLHGKNENTLGWKKYIGCIKSHCPFSILLRSVAAGIL